MLVAQGSLRSYTSETPQVRGSPPGGPIKGFQGGSGAQKARESGKKVEGALERPRVTKNKGMGQERTEHGAGGHPTPAPSTPIFQPPMSLKVLRISLGPTFKEH